MRENIYALTSIYVCKQIVFIEIRFNLEGKES